MEQRETSRDKQNDSRERERDKQKQKEKHLSLWRHKLGSLQVCHQIRDTSLIALRLGNVDTACKWKVWLNGDESADWEAWSFLPAIVPRRDLTRANIRAQKILKNDSRGWYEWLCYHHDIGSMVHNSKKSCRWYGQEYSARTHDTCAINTYGVITLFSWAATHRRTLVNRHNAQGCLAGFLHRMLPELAGVALNIGSFIDIAAPECDLHAYGNCVCGHSQSIRCAVHVDPFRCLADVLSAAWVQQCHCAAAASCIDDIAQTLASEVDKRLREKEFPDDPVKNAERRMGTQRHRQRDEDPKRAVVQRSAPGQASGGAVMRAIGLATPGYAESTWAHADLKPYVSASWRTWKDCQVMSISADASKFGRPAEETMSYAVTDGHEAGWLPVQVSSALNI